MTRTEPKVVDNARYTLQEAANILNVHRNSMTTYQKEGYFVARPVGRYKIMTGRDIKRLWKRYFNMPI